MWTIAAPASAGERGVGDFLLGDGQGGVLGLGRPGAGQGGRDDQLLTEIGWRYDIVRPRHRDASSDLHIGYIRNRALAVCRHSAHPVIVSTVCNCAVHGAFV